jgi:transcriptional regulator with XRE-family HTH domain
LPGNPCRRFSGRRLRQLRLAAGLTIEQLADDVGKSAYTVQSYESVGARRIRPSIDMLPRLAERFGVTIDELFEEVVS